jgi:hypothetical protein
MNRSRFRTVVRTQIRSNLSEGPAYSGIKVVNTRSITEKKVLSRLEDNNKLYNHNSALVDSI